MTAEGETLVRFRAVDNAGNTRTGRRTSPLPAGTARIDRTAPTNPIVTGGSTTWQSIASITISGAGSTDNGGSGLAGYQYRTSTNSGVTWTAQAPGASIGVTAEGSTLVQFRALDNAGNSSAWSPAAAGAGNTARIDRTAPTAPAVTGGATSCVKKRTIKASGSTDTLSGIDHYEYHSSMNGGAYTAPATGAAASFKTDRHVHGAVPRPRQGRQHDLLGADSQQPSQHRLHPLATRRAESPSRRCDARRIVTASAGIRKGVITGQVAAQKGYAQAK